MIGWLRRVPVWAWWLIATAVGAGVLYALTRDGGAAAAVGGVGAAAGAAAAADAAKRRAERARRDAAGRPEPLPAPAARSEPDPARWDTGPAGRD